MIDPSVLVFADRQSQALNMDDIVEQHLPVSERFDAETSSAEHQVPSVVPARRGTDA